MNYKLEQRMHVVLFQWLPTLIVKPQFSVGRNSATNTLPELKFIIIQNTWGVKSTEWESEQDVWPIWGKFNATFFGIIIFMFFHLTFFKFKLLLTHQPFIKPACFYYQLQIILLSI